MHHQMVLLDLSVTIKVSICSFCRNPVDFTESQGLDFARTPFSSFSGSVFSLTCEDLFLFLLFTVITRVFKSPSETLPFIFSSSFSVLFSYFTSNSSFSWLTGINGLPLYPLHRLQNPQQ